VPYPYVLEGAVWDSLSERDGPPSVRGSGQTTRERRWR
jgi:hypothetical protein